MCIDQNEKRIRIRRCREWAKKQHPVVLDMLASGEAVVILKKSLQRGQHRLDMDKSPSVRVRKKPHV